MSLSTGTRLGPYEIVGFIGAGGMGEVYRARDTRLERSVAVKILPQSLSAQHRERFEREARVISNLAHAHICTLFDVGSEDGTDYLVMEYLEGESLADRLARGALPLDQAIRIGAEIADALAAAHRAGVVHRDLKPGNVMLTRGGVKLLDFGLAKSVGAVALGSAPEAGAPTIQKALTAEGTILGTFQYMSPEQLDGAEVDARSDIFSLGAVLYETVTGRRAFAGKTRTSVIAAIVDRDPPPISTLQPTAPPALERVIRQCLAKNPDDRWESAHDVAAELRWIASAEPEALRPRRRGREWLAWSVAAVAAAMAAGAMLLRPRQPAAEPTESSILTPKPPDFILSGPMALSPDGRRLAYVTVATGGESMIWVRAMSSGVAQSLPGTSDASYLFWSPDSRTIAFFASGKLRKIAADGGPAQTIIEDAGGPRGGAWGADGTIVFARVRDGLYRVPASGGEVRKLTTPDTAKGEADHRFPFFLPDGRHVLYLARAEDAERSSIWVASLDSEEKKRLLPAASNMAWASGYLLFLRERVLLAQKLDPESLELRGDPVPLAQHVAYIPGTANAIFSVSSNGVLTYSPGALKTELTWFDRSGKTLGQLGAPADYQAVRLSPDDRRLVTDILDESGTSDLWLFDLARGTSSRFTFRSDSKRFPLWSPDGESIAFLLRNQPPGGDLMVKSVRGSMAEQLLWRDDGSMKVPLGWSTSGTMLLGFHHPTKKAIFDLWTYSLGERKAVPLVQSPMSEPAGSLSPDGKWMVYASNESGRYEIYVIPTTGGPKWQISSGGGIVPIWSRGGNEIFYVSADGRMMSVPVKAGTAFESGEARPLFACRPKSIAAYTYDVTADGQRFIVNRLSDDPASSPITLVTNWTSRLEK